MVQEIEEKDLWVLILADIFNVHLLNSFVGKVTHLLHLLNFLLLFFLLIFLNRAVLGLQEL